MAILVIINSRLGLSSEATPFVFWPCQTTVKDIVVDIADLNVSDFRAEIVNVFIANKIKAHIANGTAFGLRDQDGKSWYLGFKSSTCVVLGSSVHSENYVVPYKNKELTKLELDDKLIRIAAYLGSPRLTAEERDKLAEEYRVTKKLWESC